MAIEFLEVPQGQMDLGIFNLPSEFDSAKYAAEWVKKGPDVQRMQMRQPVIGMPGVTSDPWAVWKGSDKKMATVSTAKGEYILMYRDRAVQEQVNALYGNVSKGRMLREKQTSQGAAQDQQADAAGMLSSERLREAGMRDPEADDDGGFRMNVVNIKQATAPQLVVETPALPDETE